MLKKLFALFLTFAKIGGITFGGGLTMLPLLTREIVEKKKWVTEEDISNIVTKPNPPIIIKSIVDKFNKTSAQQSISVDIDVTSSDALSIELLDASGNTIDTIANWSEYSLEELKNGIYGIKVKVDENTHASGIISVE